MNKVKHLTDAAVHHVTMNSNLLEGGKKVKKGYDATERKITITYFNSNNVSLPDTKVFSHLLDLLQGRLSTSETNENN